MTTRLQKTRSLLVASLCTLAGATALSVPSPLRAAVIVDDHFNDGARTQTATGVGTGTSGETDIAWFQNASVATIVTDNTTPLVGSALQASGGSILVGTFGTGGTNVALAATGDSITVTADFHFAAAGTANIRFGLYNDNGTVASDAAAAGAPYIGDRGYTFIVLQSGARNNNYIEELDTGGTVGQGGDATNHAQSGTALTGLGTTGHTAVFTLTRTAAGGIQMAGTIDGNAYGTPTDTTPVTTSFGQVVLSGAGATVVFDNVQVTTNVPEPASLSLAAIALFAAVSRRSSCRRVTGA